MQGMLGQMVQCIAEHDIIALIISIIMRVLLSFLPYPSITLAALFFSSHPNTLYSFLPLILPPSSMSWSPSQNHVETNVPATTLDPCLLRALAQLLASR